MGWGGRTLSRSALALLTFAAAEWAAALTCATSATACSTRVRVSRSWVSWSTPNTRLRYRCKGLDGEGKVSEYACLHRLHEKRESCAGTEGGDLNSSCYTLRSATHVYAQSPVSAHDTNFEKPLGPVSPQPISRSRYIE